MNRILHLHWDGGVGGVQRWLTTAAAHLDPTRFELTIALLSRSGLGVNAGNCPGARIVELGWKRGLAPGKARELRRFLAEEQFDLIHNHVRTWLVGVELARLQGKTPLVLHEHGLLLYSPDKSMRMYRELGPIYDRFVVTNVAMEQRLGAVAPFAKPKTVLMVNPVDTEAFRPAPPQAGPPTSADRPTVVLGGLGRMDTDKGWPLWIETAQALARPPYTFGVDFTFRIMGDGPTLGSVREQARSAGILDKVEFVDPAEDTSAFLNGLDLFLFCSRREDFGMVILEAQASGLPVVAAPVVEGGAKRLLESLGGVVVAAARSPDELARISWDLAKDEPRRREMARTGRRDVVAKYGAQDFAEALGLLYEQLLHR